MVFYPEEEEEEFGDKIAGGLMTINYGGALIRTLNSKKCFFLGQISFIASTGTTVIGCQ